MSEIFSEQLSAIANMALAVLALVTAVFAWLAFQKQAKEVGDQSAMLALQRRQFDEDQAVRKRAQAAQVFITNVGSPDQGNDGTVVIVGQAQNTSRQPVYDLSARCRTDDGAFGTPYVQPLLMPGDSMTFEETWSRADGISGLSLWLEFRDASGVHWRTTDRGVLTELCGETSTDIYRVRCTFDPRHVGNHSWAWHSQGSTRHAQL